MQRQFSLCIWGVFCKDWWLHRKDLSMSANKWQKKTFLSIYMGLIGSISNGNWSHRSPVWSVIIWVMINQITVQLEFNLITSIITEWIGSKIAISEKWRNGKFLLEDWQRRHKLFNVVLKLRLVDLNYNFKCHCLLNCPITPCPIATWQINKWKITITIENILFFLIKQILNEVVSFIYIYI